MSEEVSNTEITSEDVWEVIRAFFEEETIVHQQLRSFEEFINDKMQNIIAGGNIRMQFRDSNCSINFDKAYLETPCLTESDGETHIIYPREARLRNESYSAALYVDVSKTVVRKGDDGGEIIETKSYNKVFIGKVPIMLRSSFCNLYQKPENKLAEEHGECQYDKGGYFIINGTEKVLIAQERKITNYVCVFKPRQPNKHTYVAEVRSVESNQHITPAKMNVSLLRTNRKEGGGCIHATLPGIRSAIPIVIVLKALGLESDEHIVLRMCFGLTDPDMVKMLRPSLEEVGEIQSRKAALNYIGKRRNPGETEEKRIEYATDLLQRKVLPHMGIDETCESKKAYYLGWVTHRLILCALGRRAEDDQNHYCNRRLDLAGPLLGGLFGTLFRKFTRNIRSYVEKSAEKGKDLNLNRAIDPKIITNGFNYSLSTGNWGNTRDGVSQHLNRLNYVSTFSQLRRIKSPMDRQIKPRQLHNSHWGLICPVETPEGQACGFMKNFALMTRVSVDSSADPIINILFENDLHEIWDFPAGDISHPTKIFINGRFIGFHYEPGKLVDTLRCIKRSDYCYIDLAIIWDIQILEVRLYTDYGRCRRPLFVVQNGSLIIKRKDIQDLEGRITSWKDLIAKGLVEYVDAEEEQFTLIAMTINDVADRKFGTYTHCEIHPSMILGMVASIIPAIDHNASPRNTYAAAMCKQAIGVYATSSQRMDPLAYLLSYPQKPLISTRPIRNMHIREVSNGINAVVAIITYSGYNQEDSIIMNKPAIDRGLFRSFTFRTYSDVERRKRGLVNETFGRPDKTAEDVEVTCYRKLERDGLPAVATRITENDFVIGKKVQNEGESDDRDKVTGTRTKLREGETGTVDQVLLTTNADGLTSVKVRVREQHIPEIGDKFCSLHSQKGTVGMIYNAEDMPWTAQGIIPDLMINPHAIPSRMTLGQFFESTMGKTATYNEGLKDATPFTNVSVGSIQSALFKCGYSGSGEEVMYSGHTGKKLTSSIFIGPTYYQKLKHMVRDKIWSRSRGPVENLTRQPTAGRSRGGGLRIGEMERDCLISHGAASTLKERLFYTSDPFTIHVCKRCGLISVFNVQKKTLLCTGCKENIGIVQVDLPYACKLLIQELMAMGIASRLQTGASASTL